MLLRRHRVACSPVYMFDEMFGDPHFRSQDSVVDVETPWGTVRVKVGDYAGEPVTASPEYEDCRRVAEANDVPLRRVYDAALHAFRSIP